MSVTSAFLSKLIGLYCLLAGIAMGINERSTVATVIAFVHDAPLVFAFGLLLTAAGLAMIVGHNVWSGGAAPVVVTLIGWLSLLKGFVFLVLPAPEAVGVFFWGTAYERYFYADIGLCIVLGAYLTWAGFRSTPR